MIVCGLLSGMSLVMNQMMQTMAKSNAKAQSDSEYLLTINEINAILSTPSNCIETFNGKNGLTDITTTNISRKGNARFPINAKFGNASTVISGYEVTSTPADLVNNTATLNVKFEKKKILGSGMVIKKINLYVEVDPSNNITACRSIALATSDNLWKHGSVQANINYDTGNVGVGVDSPVERLEVNGAIKIGETSSPCTPSNEGVIKYNKATHVPEYCDSTSWKSIKQWSPPGQD